MTEKETETITGVVGGITQKGEQFVIEVTPDGSKYPKKCRTKAEPVRATAAALYGQTATFECGVSHGEYEGKPVRYFWINAINPGAPPPVEPPGAEEALANVAQEATGAAVAPSEPSGGPAPAPNRAAPPRDSFGDPTRASIERQVALKSATRFHQDRPESTYADVLRDAELGDQFLARSQPF